MWRAWVPLLGLAVGGTGCVGTPSLGGVAGVAPSPNVAWTPPAREAARDTLPLTAIPADREQRIQRLTLAEVVDLGLRNNPQTRLSWANARAAAAAYGSERGTYLPTIDGDVTATRLKTVASQGRSAVTQSVLSPSLNLTAARRVATTEDLIASAEQSNEVALARYRSGVGSVLDLLSAQTALADARAQPVLARLEWNTSLAQLAHDSGVLDVRGGSSIRVSPASSPPNRR